MLLDDVDFIVSPGVVSAQQYEAIVAHTRAKQALVLPALEPYEELVGIERGVQQTMQALRGVARASHPGCCSTQQVASCRNREDP